MLRPAKLVGFSRIVQTRDRAIAPSEASLGWLIKWPHPWRKTPQYAAPALYKDIAAVRRCFCNQSDSPGTARFHFVANRFGTDARLPPASPCDDEPTVPTTYGKQLRRTRPAFPGKSEDRLLFFGQLSLELFQLRLC